VKGHLAALIGPSGPSSTVVASTDRVEARLASARASARRVNLVPRFQTRQASRTAHKLIRTASICQAAGFRLSWQCRVDRSTSRSHDSSIEFELTMDKSH